ncbi:type II secretion system protein [Vibrio cincinnatiensis]|uniref:type II secretion system protein n=1 Tax=Vibrio cincinnatiensis TaxID=675 RepID=UPI001EDE59F2|nr:type II secretion system protein [Vibrio cincinnatiensis]MCG3733737.1 type II secretion system protein [Vibrio cincinnatiensis]MCG3740260.1 type II secretion system protein [Vibrio cincinnatiensis]
MKKQGGFTLIELVVVIVILGILAVTAAPRFLNLQGDAREASLKGLQGAMKGAAGITYGKAAIKGIEKKESDSITVDNGDKVDVVYGYPAATSAGIVAAMADMANDWSVATESTTPKSLVATFYNKEIDGDADKIKATKCYLIYKEAESGAQPTIEIPTDNAC